MKKYEVKACPFCGGKVHMEKNCVDCKRCGYELVYGHKKYYLGELGMHKLKRYDAMRTAWNTRAEKDGE